MIGWLALAAASALAGWWVGRHRSTTDLRPERSTELDTVRGELAQKIDEVYALQELSFVLSESLKPDGIAERVADYVARFFPVQGVVVALGSGTRQSLRIAAGRGSLDEVMGREIPEHDAGLLTYAMGSERLQLAEREADDQPVLLSGVPVDRAAVLPLRAHGVTVGALAVANPLDRPFSSEDLRLLSTVATHAAIVLSNARFVDLVRFARDQWETTFNALTEGIAVLDERGVIRRGNRALAALAGVAVPALTGLPFVETLVGERHELRDLLQRRRGDTSHPPVTLQSDTLGRVLRLTAAPMLGEGNADWTVVLVEDVTEQQAMESQLIQNEKMAAVGQLVSGVAHELNNPLTSIAGLSEFLLEQTPETSGHREHLEVIHEQADRAGQIVRNLLTFARKGPAELVTLDLNDIVARTVDLVDYEIRLREVRLRTALDPELASVEGDRYQIQQVVLNLVANAVQAVAENPPERPRRVEISTHTDEGWAVLRVQDSGPGIPDGILSQIFTPFFTTKAPGKGTGLGLSISFRIVQGHGGTMSAGRSGMGGAAFVIRLPIQSRTPTVAEDPGTTTETGTPTPADAGTAPASRRHEILLLDNDPAVRRMISVLLAEEGAVVEIARDAEHAAHLLAEREFDLVIADPRAAVSAGERFADHLEQRFPDLRARTILVTADVRPETQTWLDQLGCRYFLKPFRMGELKAAVATLLGESDARS